jgi:WD40 repeat protein
VTGDQLSVFRGHDSWISGVSFPTSELVATAGSDGDVRLWRAGEAALAFLTLHAEPDTISFSEDGDLVVAATGSGVELRPWKPGAQGAGVVIRVPGDVNTASLSRDGHLVVVAAARSKRPSEPARVLHVPDGRSSGRTLDAGPGNGAVTATFSPDSRLILSAHRDGAARLWSSRTHRLLRRLGPAAPPSARATLLDAQFNRDGRRVATVGATGITRVFDTASGRQLASFSVAEGKPGAVQLNAVALQPGSALLATAGEDGQAFLWDTKTGTGRPMHHDDAVTSVDFSPDGTVIATASWDGTARLWDARTAQPLGVVARGTQAISSVAFSPDGRGLAVAEGDQVRVLACGICGTVADLQRNARARVNRRLTPDERRIYLGEG